MSKTELQRHQGMIHSDRQSLGGCTGEPPASVLVCLLGNFRLVRDGQPVPVRSGGKTEALLSYLGLRHDRRVAREELVDALWPMKGRAQAYQSLNSLVYSLHRLLGVTGRESAVVLQEAGFYRLNLDAGVAVDVALFDAFVSTGDEQAAAGDMAAAVESYDCAVRLYRGDIAVVPDIHAVVERERLRSRYLSTLTALADFHYAMGAFTTALDYAWRLLAQDPGREDTHRLVMRCYVRRGERAEALHHYEVCVEILRRELDVAPEAATITLVEQIRSDPEHV